MPSTALASRASSPTPRSSDHRADADRADSLHPTARRAPRHPPRPSSCIPSPRRTGRTSRLGTATRRSCRSPRPLSVRCRLEEVAVRRLGGLVGGRAGQHTGDFDRGSERRPIACAGEAGRRRRRDRRCGNDRRLDDRRGRSARSRLGEGLIVPTGSIPLSPRSITVNTPTSNATSAAAVASAM